MYCNHKINDHNCVYVINLLISTSSHRGWKIATLSSNILARQINQWNIVWPSNYDLESIYSEPERYNWFSNSRKTTITTERNKTNIGIQNKLFIFVLNSYFAKSKFLKWKIKLFSRLMHFIWIDWCKVWTNVSNLN